MKKVTPTIDVSKISLGFKTKKETTFIQKEVSFTLYPSQLVAIVGINGIGKSTLIKTLSGELPLLDGSIYINGKSLLDYSTQQLAQLISLVLTHKLPPSQLTVHELIALGRQPYTNWLDKLSDFDDSKIKDAIELTQISPIQHKKHTEISDGQFQKVLIARALAQDTPIILLDEPTTHLDLSQKTIILKLLQRITQTKGKCVVYTTHDIELALQLADTIIVIHPDGIVNGTPSELIEKGIFDTLFDNPDVRFNRAYKNYKIE